MYFDFLRYVCNKYICIDAFIWFTDVVAVAVTAAGIAVTAANWRFCIFFIVLHYVCLY